MEDVMMDEPVDMVNMDDLAEGAAVPSDPLENSARDFGPGEAAAAANESQASESHDIEPGPDKALASADEYILPIPESQVHSVDTDVFINATVVTITEVGSYLRDITQEASQAGTELHPDLLQVHDYCAKFAPRRSDSSEAMVRRIVPAKIKNPYHWGLVLNLSPESVDELINLVPQLKPGHPSSPFADEEEIQELIREMEEQRGGDMA